MKLDTTTTTELRPGVRVYHSSREATVLAVDADPAAHVWIVYTDDPDQEAMVHGWEQKEAEFALLQLQLSNHMPPRSADDFGTWEGRMRDTADRATQCHIEMERAKQVCEAAYARVLLFDYDRRRQARLKAVQEARAPILMAMDANGGIHMDVLQSEWKKLADARGNLARYVEVTLHRERMLPWTLFFRRREGPNAEFEAER